MVAKAEVDDIKSHTVTDIPTLPEVLGVSRILIVAPARPQMRYNLPESRESEREHACWND